MEQLDIKSLYQEELKEKMSSWVKSLLKGNSFLSGYIKRQRRATGR